jgi:hypothetical protein
LSRDERQTAVLAWVRETFGDPTLSIEERISRFLEEALEFAQAEGLPADTAAALLAYVDTLDYEWDTADAV